MRSPNHGDKYLINPDYERVLLMIMIGKDGCGFGNSIRHDATYRMYINYLKRHLKSLFASFCDRDVPNFMLVL